MKRGGQNVRKELQEDDAVIDAVDSDTLLALDEALTEFEKMEPEGGPRNRPSEGHSRRSDAWRRGHRPGPDGGPRDDQPDREILKTFDDDNSGWLNQEHRSEVREFLKSGTDQQIAEKSLNGHTIGPLVTSQAALIRDHVTADTRKLTSTAAFQAATDPKKATANDDAASGSLRGFFDQRREFLFNYKPAKK